MFILGIFSFQFINIKKQKSVLKLIVLIVSHAKVLKLSFYKFIFIFIPFHIFYSSFLFLYEDSHLDPNHSCPYSLHSHPDFPHSNHSHPDSRHSFPDFLHSYPTLILCTTTLIPCIPIISTLIPGIPMLIPRIPLILFLNTLFQLLQIARQTLAKLKHLHKFP